MTSSEQQVRETIKSFGFDDFMAGQITARLKHRGLIVEEPLGDAIDKVLEVLETECGMDLREVHAVVEAMMNAGVVFRER